MTKHNWSKLATGPVAQLPGRLNRAPSTDIWASDVSGAVHGGSISVHMETYLNAIVKYAAKLATFYVDVAC